MRPSNFAPRGNRRETNVLELLRLAVVLEVADDFQPPNLRRAVR